MHHSIFIPLHVMADKTVIATIHCTMILGQHVLIQSIAIITKFLLILLKECAGNAVWCEMLHFLAEQRHRSMYNQIDESKNGVRIC